MESIFSKSDSTTIDTLWDLILPQKERITESFYEILFSMDNKIQPLFKTDLRIQGIKLIDTLSFVIEHMQDIEKVIPVIKELGDRHQDYGTKPAHYEIVLEAMIETFEKHFGDSFTHEMRMKWIKLYRFMSEIMMLGSRNN